MPDIKMIPNDSEFSQREYTELAIQIVCMLRGEFSQRELSEKLGHTFNQVGKWEAGVTRIKWNDFLMITKAVGISIEDHFRRFFWNFEGDFSVVNMLEAIKKFTVSSNEFEDSTQKLIRKVLLHSANPDFEEILRILNSRPSLLVAWLSTFLDCTKILILRKPFEDFILQTETIYDDPISGYVSEALELEVYKKLEIHSEEVLAEHSGCTVEELRNTLILMKSRHLVSFDGKKYFSRAFNFSFSTVANLKLRRLTKHTLELAANRYFETPAQIDPNKIKNSSSAFVRVVAMSAPTSKKVIELITKLHNDIGELVKNDQLPKENVQVIIGTSFTSNINS